jgi:hypothetical protein
MRVEYSGLPCELFPILLTSLAFIFTYGRNKSLVGKKISLQGYDAMWCAREVVAFQKNLQATIFTSFTLLPWRWRLQVRLNQQFLSIRLHGVTPASFLLVREPQISHTVGKFNQTKGITLFGVRNDFFLNFVKYATHICYHIKVEDFNTISFST